MKIKTKELTYEVKKLIAYGIMIYWPSGDHDDWTSWVKSDSDEDDLITLELVTGIDPEKNPEEAIEKFLDNWWEFIEFASSAVTDIISGDENLDSLYLKFLRKKGQLKYF
jgi:hypothetical protein